MTRLLLATFDLLPGGEPGGVLLVEALARHGVEAAWAVWDDPVVDWAAADAVAVRSAWDYHRRTAEFLDWARAVEKGTVLLNGADVMAWNADKAYLVGLAAHVPTVPTATIEARHLAAGLRAALARWGAVVVKARVGASGVGVVVAEAVDDQRLTGLTAGPWVVQPLVGSVRTRGESSVFVLGGEPVSQVDKLPGDGEIRVHEQYGGHSRPAPLDRDAADVARQAMAAAEQLLGHPLDYGRVDLMEHEGRLMVSELELIEPGLYLDVLPGNADPFAAMVGRRLAHPG